MQYKSLHTNTYTAYRLLLVHQTRIKKKGVHGSGHVIREKQGDSKSSALADNSGGSLGPLCVALSQKVEV